MSAEAAGRFAGRVAVVTGGAGGLGRATCEALLEQGASVAVVDINQTAVDQAVVGLDSGRAHGFAVDVTDPAAVSELMATVRGRAGGPHLLVNCAGGSLGTPRDLGDITPDDVDLVLGVNLKGAFFCCQAVTPHMAEAGGGVIVNVSSIGGRSASPVTGVPYAAAKAGVLGLTRRLAREVGPQRIRVNAV
ncbi:MAG: SDR family NAD(P)-dependent oxidoreductase, partial [Micromonosporaceae bacterium]